MVYSINSNIKALVFDLDGTLLAPGSVLTERTVRAVRACAEKGMTIILATGRAIKAAEKFRTALEVSGPMVYFNGAVVADMPGEKILHTALLDPGAVDFCIDLSRRLGLYYQVYLPSQILTAEKRGAEFEMYQNHTGLTIEIADLKETMKREGSGGVIKSMFIAEGEVLDKTRPLLEEHFSGGRKLTLVRSYPVFLELMNAQASKGIGLAFALKARGINPENTMAFGDEENDLSLFDGAAYSAAPANAKDAVKARADFITGPNSEDGVAAFLEENFLR